MSWTKTDDEKLEECYDRLRVEQRELESQIKSVMVIITNAVKIKSKPVISYNDKKEQIITLGRGQVVGEMALIKGYHHSASVTAMEEVEAWVITTKYINKEMARMSSLMNLILLSLVERLYNQTFLKE